MISPARVGYLTKQGIDLEDMFNDFTDSSFVGGSIQNWKRRFFVLKDNFLFYYKKPTVRNQSRPGG